MLAYLLMNYDIKPLEERPPCNWIGKTMVPPTASTMEIRRKQGTSTGTGTSL